MAARKGSTKPRKDQLYEAQLTIEDLGNLFACIRAQVSMLDSPEQEHVAVAIESIAARGVREADEIIASLIGTAATEGAHA